MVSPPWYVATERSTLSSDLHTTNHALQTKLAATKPDGPMLPAKITATKSASETTASTAMRARSLLSGCIPPPPNPHVWHGSSSGPVSLVDIWGKARPLAHLAPPATTPSDVHAPSESLALYISIINEEVLVVGISGVPSGLSSQKSPRKVHVRSNQ